MPKVVKVSQLARALVTSERSVNMLRSSKVSRKMLRSSILQAAYNLQAIFYASRFDLSILGVHIVYGKLSSTFGRHVPAFTRVCNK